MDARGRRDAAVDRGQGLRRSAGIARAPPLVSVRTAKATASPASSPSAIFPAVSAPAPGDVSAF